MNKKLYLRNPEDTELGRKIIHHSLTMIHEQGFESFTFKKLAIDIGTTEASIYRYFENKHRLLVYIVCWYWSWLEYQVLYHTYKLKSPVQKLKKIIRILSSNSSDPILFPHIDKDVLHQIVIAEGSKAYLTKHVAKDNQDKFFKPYKDLCAKIAGVISECNPGYAFSHSLASTIIEIAHLQNFFQRHLPSLTDFGKKTDNKMIIKFIDNLVFNSLK